MSNKKYKKPEYITPGPPKEDVPTCETIKQVPTNTITSGPHKCLNNKVAIVGFAPSWNLAPFDDPTFDVWGINELYIQAVNKRFTHWFEIHNPESPSKKSAKHQEWLKNCKIPIFMQQHYEQFPASIPYPREVIKSMVNKDFILNDVGSPYTDFSNQITWMILAAIYMDYKEIHVYGVDMAQQSEYAWQRSSCQFAIGFAVGRGIKILVPKTSELCKYPRDYGFDTDNVNRFMAKDRVKILQQTAMSYQGQVHDIEYQYKIKHEDFVLLKNNLTNELTRIGDEVVKLDVMLNKNKEIINFLQNMPLDLETIDKKKGEIVTNILNQNSTMEKAIKDLEQKAITMKDKLEKESKLDFINAQILETTKKNIEKQIMSCNGAIGECNYNLSNNRV